MTKLHKENEDYNEHTNHSIEEILNSIKNTINHDTVNTASLNNNNATDNNEDDNDILVLTEIISTPNQNKQVNINTAQLNSSNIVKNHLPNITADVVNLIPKSTIESKEQKSPKKVHNNINKQNQNISICSNQTIEDIVIELLKPKLSEWLDNHLSDLVKSIVEPIVAKEVREQLSKTNQSNKQRN